MSVYFIKGKGWRYDFTLNGIRHTESGFKTKLAARKAEVKRREDLESPAPKTAIQTDMAFLDLVNRRLDNVKAYHSVAYYEHYVYMARRWVKIWGKLLCGQITQDMVEQFIFERKKVSAYTANKEIRYLRALFNFARKKELIARNPVDGIAFLPVTKKLKYITPSEDIDRVIAIADPDIQDYLWTIRETMARMSEINALHGMLSILSEPM